MLLGYSYSLCFSQISVFQCRVLGACDHCNQLQMSWLCVQFRCRDLYSMQSLPVCSRYMHNRCKSVYMTTWTGLVYNKDDAISRRRLELLTSSLLVFWQMWHYTRVLCGSSLHFLCLFAQGGRFLPSACVTWVTGPAKPT